MSSAQWVTEPNLGSFVESYNFNLNPLTIGFASDMVSVVITLNGALPAGLQYTRASNTLIISGVSTGVTTSTTSYFTFRVTDPDGTIDDRTYNLTITPVAIVPSWEGQNPFLGYMTVNTTATFTVTATISNNAIIQYNLVPTPPAITVPSGMSIDFNTGAITYANAVPLPVTTNFDQTYPVTVVASSGGVSESLPVTITVLGRDHAPGWITNAGSLGTVVIDQWIEVELQTYEPNGGKVTYTLNNPPPDFPFTLTPTGFLYGEAPLTATQTLWAFVVDATSSQGTSSQSFDILVIAGPSNQLTWNNTSGEVGSWLDGQYVNVPVTATSTRTPRIMYTFAGGSLPPDLRLSTSQGMLVGFLEFHPQPRDYYFEIAATDGIQSITQQFHIEIQRDRLDRYLNVQLPVQGELKQALLTTRQAMIPYSLMSPAPDTVPFIPVNAMNLVSGLAFQSDDPTVVMSQIAAEAHSMELLVGLTSNVNVNDDYTVYYRNIIDLQANASPTTTRLVGNISVGNTAVSYNPISLNNIRSALISDLGFVNGGSGTGASFLATVDQFSTSITNVLVVSSGTGYYSSPELVVTGTGNGAVVTANLTVQSVNVIYSSAGWTAGEVFNVIIDSSHVLLLQAANVDAVGTLQNVAVIDGSTFTVFPHGSKVISDSNSAIATVSFDLGISSVDIVSGGAGYSPLTSQNVIVSGSEILPDWQTTWVPALYIGSVLPNFVNAVIGSTTVTVENIMGSLDWEAQWIELLAEGRSWTGNTMFDEEDCSFDGGATRFIEWIEPKDTIFDYDGNTTFDIQGTVFDGNCGLGALAYDIWSNNIWDPNVSIFDVYASLFDDVDADVTSTTTVTRLYRLKSQQVGNYNRSY